VVQPVEKYHDRWIAYSLGNFIFDQQGPNTHRGLMLKAIVRDQHVFDVQSIPIDINSRFQAKLAATTDHPANPVLVERKTTEISAR
jgi:poly-gamma-glutamate capsule biosynthesis protein CapA/YwtB (metallophosphatase superfamily)